MKNYKGYFDQLRHFQMSEQERSGVIFINIKFTQNCTLHQVQGLSVCAKIFQWIDIS